jgi:hypothetical protein
LKKLVPPILSAEAQNMVMHVTLGGDEHRKNTTDAFISQLSDKFIFTTGDKLREVCLLVCNLLLHYL